MIYYYSIGRSFAPQDNATLAGRGDRQRKREPDSSLFLCQTASGIRFMRQQIAGTTPIRLRSFHTASGMRSHVTSIDRLHRNQYRGFNTASGMRSHVTMMQVAKDIAVEKFQYRKRYEVTCDVTTPRRENAKFSRFNTASGMRSHVTLCLGGRRNRRLKSWFWKTSSKPNM